MVDRMTNGGQYSQPGYSAMRPKWTRPLPHPSPHPAKLSQGKDEHDV